MAEHSPLPWSVCDALPNIGKGAVLTGDGLRYMRGDDYEPEYMRLADAAFIVKAVNHHDELVTILRRHVKTAESQCRFSDELYRDSAELLARVEAK